MGSKSQVIHKIAPIFPAADNFYDLFGGGYSVSHFMTKHFADKYKQFIYNEIKSDVVDLVKDAIAGKYNYDVFKPAWISREQFNSEKKTNAYVRCLWSFGNDQRSYLFSRENERIKKSLHQAVVFNLFDKVAIDLLNIKVFPEHLSIRGRRLICRGIITRQGELQHLEGLEGLERLERLQRLEAIERKTINQTFLSKSYLDIKIESNSVIYCDPPYKNTNGYVSEFDHDIFWEWAMDQKEPVFVSEYVAPKNVNVIMAFHKKSNMSATMITNSVEKVFGNSSAMKILKSGLGIQAKDWPYSSV